MTSPRPSKSLLCKAIPKLFPAAEALAAGGVSHPEKMKMAVTLTDRSRSEGPGLVPHKSFVFFYQRVTEAGLALATLDPEDLRYVFFIQHVRRSV